MKVLLSLDPSSSLPKAIAQYPDGSIELFTLSPNITECTREEITDLCSFSIDNPDNTWVGYGSRYFALGGLAQSLSSVDKTRCAKFEKAAVIAMAIAALIGRKFSRSNYQLDLGILLPFDELSHKDYLMAIFKEHLKNFTSAGGQYSIESNWVSIAPEGIGCIFQGRTCQKPLNQTSIFCITIGYRNTSFIHWKNGMISRGGATDMGFHNCVSYISQSAGLSHVSKERLIPLILDKPTKKGLSALCQGQDAEIRELEVRKIKSAIARGKQAYLLKIKEWISTLQIPLVDELVIAGGTAYAFRKDFEKFFVDKPIDWRDKSELELNARLENPNLPYRLIDLWGFHKSNQIMSQILKESA
jgi:hypothetical protein